MRKTILTAASLLLFITMASAQRLDFKIRGRVTTESGVALGGAKVQIPGTDTWTKTDGAGNFELAAATDAPEIRVHKDGFADQAVRVAYSGNENRTTYVEILLDTLPKEIQEIVIDNPSLVTNSRRKLQKELDEIPGGVALVDLSAWKLRSSQTLKDAIGSQPGVIIQQFFGGNDQPRLNVRGSGIQSNPQSRGVTILQDGVPINQTDGSYIIGAIEPQASHLVEIFKGSNASQFGSSTLGGAINFITKNGYNSSPLAVKLSAGSFGTFNGVISSGFASGKSDGYLSLAYNSSDGFREHNSSRRINALANLGYRFSDRIESRILVNYTNLSFDIPGPLTKAQYMEDPRQINGKMTPKNIGPNVQVDQPGRKAQVFRIASTSAFKLGSQSRINATLYSQYTDDSFTFPIAEGVRSLLNADSGLNLSFQNTTDRNHLTAGATLQSGSTLARYFINKGGQRADLFAKEKLGAAKEMVFVNDVYSITDKFKINATMQLSWDRRKVQSEPDDPARRPVFAWATGKTTFMPASAPLDAVLNYTGFNPKIGLIYEAAKNIQFFGNASKSYEPPTFLEILNLKGGSPASSATSIGTADLRKQTALTFELGSRGSLAEGRFSWDLSLYSSELKDELLALTDINGITGQTINSDGKTVHRGVEAGLRMVPVQNILAQKDKIQLSGAYTYSDFYFKTGAYQGNRIAGIPRHYLVAEFQYEHPVGLALNFNVESLPQKTPIDHHNELYQDPYTLLNARISFSKKHWGIYVEGRNLGNKNYASSYLVRDATAIPAAMQKMGATKESATNYIPGVGRNFSVGLNFTL